MPQFEYEPMFEPDEPGHLATYGEAFKEYGRNAGAIQPNVEWILTPWDTWEKNPFYTGTPGRHPEDDYEDEEVYGPFQPVVARSIDADDIPF
jgi:hypothetical protein